MHIPRFLLTAGASGSGKTLITCGLLKALKNRGLTVASFKCGPDYIDPMFHARVIGTKSGNLDTFFTDQGTTRYLLGQGSRDCDIAVMEGVMGYYDGVGGTTTRASAYELAEITKTPAILIVNCKGMSVSVLAYIKGFLEFMPHSGISGVLLNQISPMLYQRVKKMIEAKLQIPVFGYIPRMEDCVIESRHLGLVMPKEVQDLQEKLQRLAEILENTVDIEGLMALARRAPELEIETEAQMETQIEKEKELPDGWKKRRKDGPLRIGLARDEAFCFLYEENLKLLRELGAELVEFSPIHDKELPPDLEGLLLYGGYPELYGEQLEKNETMRQQIQNALKQGLPVMAECGGFMYLHDTFENMEGRKCAGIGVIPGNAYKTPKLSRFGYVEMASKTGLVFEREIGACPAHEFHYFDSENCGSGFLAVKPESSRSWECMHSTDTLLAGFPHFYYYGNPRLAEAFLNCCGKYRESQNPGGRADEAKGL